MSIGPEADGHMLEFGSRTRLHGQPENWFGGARLLPNPDHFYRRIKLEAYKFVKRFGFGREH
jgi:hypothetical protein